MTPTIHPPIGKGSQELTNLQTELNYLDLFKIYCIFLVIWIPNLEVGVSEGGCGDPNYQITKDNPVRGWAGLRKNSPAWGWGGLSKKPKNVKEVYFDENSMY